MMKMSSQKESNVATWDEKDGSTIRAERIAETAVLSLPWQEVACLGVSCLVDAARGSKLKPRRAEHVTQVGVVCLAYSCKRAT